MLPFNPLVTHSLTSNTLVNFDGRTLFDFSPSVVRGQYPSFVTVFTVFPDGRLGAGFNDGKIRIWNRDQTQFGVTGDLTNGCAVRALAILPPHPKLVPSEYSLASGCEDGKISIWSTVELGREKIKLCEMTTMGGVGVTAFAILRSGMLASGYADGSIRIWDPFEHKLLHIVTEARKKTSSGVAATEATQNIPVKFLAATLRPDGDLISAYELASNDVWGHPGMEIWDSKPLVPPADFLAFILFFFLSFFWPKASSSVVVNEFTRVGACAVLNDGRLVVVDESGTQNQVSIYSDRWTHETFYQSADQVTALALFPDERLALAFSNDIIRIFDLHSFQQLHEIRVGGPRVTCLAPLDGKLVAGFADGKIVTFPMVTETLLAQFTQLLETNHSLVVLINPGDLPPQLRDIIKEKVERNIPQMAKRVSRLQADLDVVTARTDAANSQRVMLEATLRDLSVQLKAHADADAVALADTVMAGVPSEVTSADGSWLTAVTNLLGGGVASAEAQVS